VLRRAGRGRGPVLEGLDRRPPADHEGVGDEPERIVVDLGPAFVNAACEARIDAPVLGGLFLRDDLPVDREAAAPLREQEALAADRLDRDVPGLRTRLAPVEDATQILSVLT